MPATNVKSYWSGGDLYFADKDGAEICHFDGTNRKLVFPSGSALDLDAAASILSLADASVGAAKAKVFVSTEQTGTGSAQNVAHGLGAVPALVLVVPTELPDAAAETGFDIAEGTHTSTNVVVTVTSTVKFKVLAWA